MTAKKVATVLIVEDSDTDRENYCRLLRRNEQYDFRFLEADNGEEGLALFRQHQPDCVLLDYNLPDIDGIEFLATIQEESADYSIPVVVMLTGQGTSTVAVEAMRRGAMDYLVKSSLDNDVLNGAVNTAIVNISRLKERPSQRFDVLIVEDNETDRELYKRLLRETTHNRFEFIEVETGAEGIESLARMPVDCILLDYNLPDFTGLEFLTQVGEMTAKAHQAMPVIVMLTGQGSESIAVEAMKRGAQDYLVKNELNRELLSRSVSNAVEKNTLQLRLRDKEREFEQFCYAVAHDLQAPLRRCRQFLGLLTENLGTQLGDTANEYLSLIESNMQSQQTLIKDLLGYYSVEHIHEGRSTVDIATLVETAKDNLVDFLQQRNAVIEVDGKFPPIKGYATALLQLFQNLIENGVKYNLSAQPTINIRCYETIRHWQFTVSDNGIGIEKKYAKSIFKPFFRTRSKVAASGTGLGLAICKKVVTLHGGHIWFESEPGCGSKFCILLPREME